MFIRIAKQKRGDKIYRHLQVAESFRDPTKGNSPRTRIIAHLGTVEGLGADQIERLIDGLRKAIDKSADKCGFDELTFAHDFGHVYAASRVWDSLGLSEALRCAGLDGETTFCAVELVKLLVVNRICDPCSKLALLEWLDSVRFPGFEEKRPAYQHLLRAMDRLIGAKEKAEPLVAKLFRPKNKPKGDLVFYDITSIWFDGDRSLVEDDIRRFGYSRDGRFDRRQITIGVVMSSDGIPLCHHVFPGNTVDKTTVAEVVADLKSRFNLRSVIFVGDRGMLSDDNVDALLAEEFGNIVAHPLRRGQMAREGIKRMADRFDRNSQEEQYTQDVSSGIRCVLAYSPEIAIEVREGRKQRLATADALIKERQTRLKNPAPRGRKPTAQGTYDRIRDYLRDKGLLSLYQMKINGDKVAVKPDKKARAWEEAIDGMLLLETTDQTSSAEEVVKRYKELAEIERGWRALKSTLELRPVYHWTEERIRAHVFMCVLALQVERWMRKKLAGMSVPSAIRQLRRIKMVEITEGNTKRALPTRLTTEQKEILRKLGVPAPEKMAGNVV
ncbi:MAG: IS1634 family transposase [Desulfuromonadales bacterium]|nr:IS1634 family transposase [Desulfuromonadales bacterium]